MDKEKVLERAVMSSSEVRDLFRKELVPMAFEIYKAHLKSSDPKIQKSAADSIMKIEGSLQNSAAAAGNTGVTLNLDFSKLQDMSRGLEKITTGVVKEIDNASE